MGGVRGVDGGMDRVMEGWQERRDRQKESETDRNEWTNTDKS